MPDLTEALDLLDLAIASFRRAGFGASREGAAEVAAAARRRQDFFSDSIVVAIAGGTGSGKSSLLNAIAGETISETSELRPHTNEPLAWVPAGDHAIAAMVASVGIEEVVLHDDGPALAIVDLPDLDSVDDRHRTLVESVLPIVDAVVWMFDPIKYHDPSIHDDFLADVTEYEPVFTFVLNKIDRLDEAETEAVVDASRCDPGHGRIRGTERCSDRGKPSRGGAHRDRITRCDAERHADRETRRSCEGRRGHASGRQTARSGHERMGRNNRQTRTIGSEAHSRIGTSSMMCSTISASKGRFGPKSMTSSEDSARVDQALLRRAELAATVAVPWCRLRRPRPR